MERRGFLTASTLAAAALATPAKADGLQVLYVNRRYRFTINPENAAGDPAEVLLAQWSVLPWNAEVDEDCGQVETGTHCYAAYITPFKPGPLTITCRAVTRSGKPITASFGCVVEQSADPEAASLNLRMA
jgi:hypothetical protein